MTRGYPIFEGSPGIPIMDKDQKNTYLLKNYTMNYNHSTAVITNMTAQNTRKRKSMMKNKSKNTTPQTIIVN